MRKQKMFTLLKHAYILPAYLSFPGVTMTQFAGKKIMILAQDTELIASLEPFLKEIGYTLLCYQSYDQFEDRLFAFDPHFLIVGSCEEKNEAYALVSTVRERERFRALPILVIGGGELFEKINFLNVGADGFLPKPVGQEELKVKIQALFRRSMSYHTSNDDVVYKNLKLSPLSREAFIGENKVEFTETEFKLLEALIVEKGRPVRRELLAHRSLSSRNKSMRTIDVHINSIRGKLGQIGRKIKTLRGKGYMLVD